jgi:hypothetical protein
MNLEEKIKKAISNGIICDIDRGKIIGVRGNDIGFIYNGYERFDIWLDNKVIHIRTHQFIFYKKYGYIPECIDHINRNKLDNRIENLREVTKHQNNFNRNNTKGYSWCKIKNKYKARIKINNKLLWLGSFDNETDAHNAYLNAKSIYHII